MQKKRHDATEQRVADMLQLFIILWTVDTLEIEGTTVVLVQARVGESSAREDGVGDGRQRRQGKGRDLAKDHGGKGVVNAALLSHGDGITS